MQEGQGAMAQEEREAYDDNEDEIEDDNETDSMDNDANNVTELMQEGQLPPGIRALTGPFNPCLRCLSKCSQGDTSVQRIKVGKFLRILFLCPT